MAASNKIQVGYIEAQDGAQFQIDAGTAAAPGLVFDDSAATGLYSPGTGQIAFSTSSKQTALRILADGKVGVDCSPTVAFEVNGTIKASAIDAPIEGTLDDWIVHAGDTNTKIGFPDVDQFQVQTGGSPRLTVTDSTTTATGTILANAGVTITDNQYLNLGAANGSDARLWHDGTGGGHTYLFSYHSSGVLKIADDTNVIIGKTTAYNYINCTPTTTELFAGGNKKLETTGSGIDVTGSVVSDDLIVTGTSVVGDFKSTNNNNVLGIAGNNASDKAYVGTDSSGNFLLATGSGVENRLSIHADGKLSVGTTSAGYGQWSFVNIGSSGADATGGETGLTIRSDEGFTNTDVTGSDNWTLKIRNNAYAGSGVSGNQGTVAKILFSGVTSNGHNSYVNIGCDTQGTGANKGDFFVVTGGNAERLRIKSSGVVNIGANLTQTTYPFSVQKDLNSGGNLAYFANSDGTYSQGITLSFDSNKDIKWEGGSGSGGLIWKMGTRGYVWKIGSSDKLTIGSTGTLTLNNAITTHEANIAHFQSTTNNKSGTVRINGHSGTNAVQGILELIGYAAGGGHGRHAFITSSSESGNYATQMSFKVRHDATWQHTSIPDKLTINSGYTGTVDVKGIPAHLRLYSQRDSSDWDANDEIGKIEFHVGDDASNNLPYTTNFIKSVNTVDNKNEPDGAIVFGSCRHNQSGGAVETMRLSHSEHYDNVANLQTQGVGAIRDVYNMMNIAPDGSFDNVTNNSDGGATYWNVENGTTIKLHSTSGGHGGNWGRGIALRQAGWYYWRMCVRVTDTCGAIHGNTSTSKYKYPIAFRFNLHASGVGNDCNIQLWNEFATSGTCNGNQSGTGTLATGTMVTKTGNAVYLPQSTYQPIYHTNGYQGVRLLNIYSLELVQCGAPTAGSEHNGTW